MGEGMEKGKREICGIEKMRKNYEIPLQCFKAHKFLK